MVVLGADPDVDAAELALDAGASGYLHQSRGVEVLVSALERMPNGEQVIDLPDAGPTRRPRRASHADTVAATLTGRERECLSLLVAGLDTAAIVARMGVSRTTVRTHLQSVLTKLGVHSRLEAASFAVRHHLVDAWAEPGLAGAASGAVAGAGAGAGAPGLGRALGLRLACRPGLALLLVAGRMLVRTRGASLARRSAAMRRELAGADQRSALRRPAVGAA